MKKPSKPKTKVIKDLASYFDHELQTQLPITVLPNGSMVYKTYLIKKTTHDNWGVFDIHSKDLVNQFFLKSCALMAAKAYSVVNVSKVNEIKQLDNRYWASYCDTLVYKKNIKTAKDFDRYIVLLNKLEHSESLSKHFKEQISIMFKWSFV